MLRGRSFLALPKQLSIPFFFFRIPVRLLSFCFFYFLFGLKMVSFAFFFSKAVKTVSDWPSRLLRLHMAGMC